MACATRLSGKAVYRRECLPGRPQGVWRVPHDSVARQYTGTSVCLGDHRVYGVCHTAEWQGSTQARVSAWETAGCMACASQLSGKAVCHVAAHHEVAGSSEPGRRTKAKVWEEGSELRSAGGVFEAWGH